MVWNVRHGYTDRSDDVLQSSTDKAATRYAVLAIVSRSTLCRKPDRIRLIRRATLLRPPWRQDSPYVNSLLSL